VLTDAFGRSAAQTLASEVGRDGVQRRRAQGRDLFDSGIDLGR